jgi:hypothetical protein
MGLRALDVKGTKVWVARASGVSHSRSDVTVERSDHGLARHLEPAAQIVSEADPEFGAGFGEAKERISVVTAKVASGSGADLSPRDLTPDIVLRSVGVEGNFGPFQHHQQFRRASGSLGSMPRRLERR